MPTSKKLTRQEYRKQLLSSYKDNKKPQFGISKVRVSKNDPVISTVNKVLETIK
ncbi:hypothetical protein SFC15_06230 [Shouchella clausii]